MLCMDNAERHPVHIPCMLSGEWDVESNKFVCRYWSMYKLPMFGCSDAGQVLTEIGNAAKTFPNAYIR